MTACPSILEVPDVTANQAISESVKERMSNLLASELSCKVSVPSTCMPHPLSSPLSFPFLVVVCTEGGHELCATVLDCACCLQ